MMLQEGHYDCTVLPSSGGLRRRSSAKLEDRPVDTGLHKLPSAKEEVHQPYSRHQQRACSDEDTLLECRVSRAVSDPGYLRGEPAQDATNVSPTAAGMLGRFASLSAAAINSSLPSLPLLRGFSSSTSKADSSTSSSGSSSDTTQQQRDQATREYLARQDQATTTILLTRDCDATQAAARRHTSAAAAKAWPVRDPQHLISTGDSSASSDLHDALAGNVAAEAVGADVASSGYMEGEAPAGSLGVPGARLLLATAVSVGKGTYKFKSDKDPKKSD